MEVVGIIITGLSILISIYIVSTLSVKLRFQEYDKTLTNLTLPSSIFVTGLIGFILCTSVALCLIFFKQEEEHLFIAILLFLISILYVWLMMYSLNWRIIIKKDSFTFRNSLRISKEYSYSDIVKIKRIKIGGFRLYLKNGKNIAVDFYVKGIDNLWDILKMRF